MRFARVVSDTTTRAEVLPLLADAILAHVGTSGVCVVEIGDGGGARVAVTRGLPAAAETVVLDPDAMGEELGRAVSEACGRKFAAVETRPIVASGNLFGAVVMLFGDVAARERALKLAEGFIDLAAIALGEAVQIERLERSHADLRVSQDALARTEKLRALGQMAAGISHDLKNILNPLALHLQVVDRAILRGDTAEARESVTEMRQVVMRGVETVERLRAYSRQSKVPKAELVDLDALVREAASIAKPRMATTGNVLFVVEELRAPPRVLADGSELVSALVNLVVNAIDAAGSVGKTLKLRSGESDGGSFIEVEDDGPGMSPDIERRVFEPFFTTKGAEGTGLGLAMVYGTVQRYGGSIELDTAVGRGTRFRLWFPQPP